jgi:hypothetical protein
MSKIDRSGPAPRLKVNADSRHVGERASGDRK